MYTENRTPRESEGSGGIPGCTGKQLDYNAMLMRWALMPSLANGLTTTHYYYPKSGSWTDANGTRVHAPEGVKVRTSAASGAKSSGKVFGTTHRSGSVHA